MLRKNIEAPAPLRSSEAARPGLVDLPARHVHGSRHGQPVHWKWISTLHTAGENNYQYHLEEILEASDTVAMPGTWDRII